MSETQNDIAIKAMGLLLQAQSKPRAKKGPDPVKLGTIRHINMCRANLPVGLRKIVETSDFSDDNIVALRPFLKPVNLFYQEALPKGKVWQAGGGKKEQARAQKRLAKAA